MKTLTWSEAKEIVDIAIELGYKDAEIIKEIRRTTEMGLKEAAFKMMDLLSVSEHPEAQARYENMRKTVGFLNHLESWDARRLQMASVPLDYRLA